jgi:nitrite reductase (NO-forming)
MQGEVYTAGGFGDPGLQPFSMEKAMRESPDYVVFNGSVGCLMQDNALEAQVGERIRIFFGNGGPNLSSSFHIIGMVLVKAYSGAGPNDRGMEHVQTITVPSGSAAIVEATARVPGTYVLVDHAIFRAFNKGAAGELKVVGPPQPGLFSGHGQDEIYQPPMLAELPAQPKAPVTLTRAQRLELGAKVFTQRCQVCHQADGRGLPGAVPPLAGSDYLAGGKARAIATVVHGLSGPVTVNGQTFNSVMPAWNLPDHEVASVLTHVYASFGNKGDDVTLDDVRAVRGQGADSGGSHGS